MTQQTFAEPFRLSINTRHHWELAKPEPKWSTRTYLLVIVRAPRVVQRRSASHDANRCDGFNPHRQRKRSGRDGHGNTIKYHIVI